MCHREKHRETGSTGALHTTEQSISSAEILPAKKKMSQGGKLGTERTSQAAQAHRVSVQHRLRAASQSGVDDQDKKLAETLRPALF